MARLSKGFKVNADGKVVKTSRKMDVSARIRQKKSKKVRVVRKGGASSGNTT